MAQPPAHSFEEDTRFERVVLTDTYGESGVLRLIPNLTPDGVGEEAELLKRNASDRNYAYDRWKKLLTMPRQRKPGLDSIVTNDARTMFGLAVFLTSSSSPRRIVSVGSQGPRAERRAGKSERALAAWWNGVDEQRILNGEEPFQYDLAYWLCLYGAYAIEYGAKPTDDGAMKPVAHIYDPSECYAVYSDGLERFVHAYECTLAELWRIALDNGVVFKPNADANRKIKVVDYWWRTPEEDVIHCIALSSLRSKWEWLVEPQIQEGLSAIPVIYGHVGGGPKGYPLSGSVLADNEALYSDFNEWLSFFKTLSKESAQGAYLARGLDISDEDLKFSDDVRAGSKVILTDNPEADIKKVVPNTPTSDVAQIFSILDAMLQRGGFPYIIYGGLGRELSGFAISQLLQAAERRIGPQVRRLSLIDSLISQRWLEMFRDGDYEETVLKGYESGDPRKAFVEEFKPRDVPPRFGVVTEVPIRVGNDMMARMAIARQALGAVPQVLDHVTVLDEILQIQDPSLIMDRLAQDEANRMTMPLQVAIELKQKALDLREKGAADVAKLVEVMAERLILQVTQQLGPAPAGTGLPPEQMPPEALGVSPDVIRAARQEGPPPNATPAGGAV